MTLAALANIGLRASGSARMDVIRWTSCGLKTGSAGAGVTAPGAGLPAAAQADTAPAAAPCQISLPSASSTQATGLTGTRVPPLASVP